MKNIFFFKLILFSFAHSHQNLIHTDVKESTKIIEKLEKNFKLSTDKALLEKVTSIAKPLIQIVNKEKLNVIWGDKNINNFKYIFKIIDEKEINAFSLPGGFIYVYKGLLDYVESDDELAGVLAHEISHVAFRHGHHIGQEQNKTLLFAIPALLLGAFIGGENGIALGQASILGSQLIVSNWSQKAEWAADYGAFQMLVKSKYNPVGILTFQERLIFDEQFKGKIDMGIYQTHPFNKERAKKTLDFLQKYNISVKRSEVSKSMSVQLIHQQNQTVDLQFLGNSIHLFKGSDGLARAQKSQVQINSFFDSMPNLFSIKIQNNKIQTLLGVTLLEVTSSDANNAPTDVQKITNDAYNALKRAVYYLNGRLALNRM